MAKLLPTSIDIATDYSEGWRERETESLERLRDLMRESSAGDLVGERLRWQRADSYAEYIIVKESPFTIAHLAIGDAWQVEPALVRGLRIGDAREMVERERAMAELFKEARGE
jgi:hypothetical protein